MSGKRWFGRIIVYYLLVLVILRIGFGSFAWYFPRSIFFADVTTTSLLELVNSARQEEDLPGLVLSPKLNLTAYQKAQDMLEGQYFAHYSPEGVGPWHWFEKVGYHYRYAGENLAIHFFDSEEVHRAWMESKSHRDNILNPNYQEMGLAVVQGDFGGRPTAIVVQHFGTPSRIVQAEQEVGRETYVAEEPAVEKPFEPDVELPETGLDEKVPPEDFIPDAPIEPTETALVDYEGEEWRLLGAASVATTELSEDNWFRFFKVVSTSYERIVQQLIFYGVILVALYFAVSVIRQPERSVIKICGRTALMALLLLLLSLLTKDLVWQWMSYQVTIG